MSTPIVIQYIWNEENFIRGNSYYLKSLVRTPIRILFYVFSSLIFILGCIAIYSDGIQTSSVIIVLAGAYLLFLRHFEYKYFARRRFKKRPDKNKNIRIEVTEDLIKSEVEDIGKSEANWNSVFKALRTKEGIIIYPNDGIYHWLPNHAFQSEDELNQFWDLVKRKVKLCKNAF
jgi:hypothetical protein